MTLTFDVQMADIVAFNQYHFQHSPAVQRGRKRIMAGIIIGIVISMIYGGVYEHSLVYVITSAILGIVLLYIASKITHYHSARSIQHIFKEGTNKTMLGRHTLNVTDEGLTEITEYTTTHIKWEGIERIVSTPDYTFVYLSAVTAAIIPRESILDGDYKPFIEYIIMMAEQRKKSDSR
ncbi:MAG: YcxB family protein [bacterium]|nr:YcxB family protein [bacterium]